MTQILRGLNVGQSWGGVNASSMLGVKPDAMVAQGAMSQGAMQPGSTTPLDANGDKPWHPDSPLFWFGILLATTFGLIGAATSIRVGPFKAAVGAGKT